MNEEEAQPTTPSRPAGYRRAIIIGSVVVLLAAAGLIYWILSRGRETTDDAQIYGHLVAVTARVSGNVQKIMVDNTDKVNAGDLLVQIDQRDYLQTLNKARADLAAQRAQTAAAEKQTTVTSKTAPSTLGQATAAVSIASEGVDAGQAQLASAEAQVKAAEAGVRAAREQASAALADIDAAQAQVENARELVTTAEADVAAAESEAKTQTAELNRYKYLKETGAAAQQQLDVVQNRYNTSQAALRAARSRVLSARTAVNQARAREAAAQALLARANSQVAERLAALEQARAGVRSARVGLSQARARLRQAEAAQYGTETVPQQIGISEAQRRAAAARIAQAQADIRRARLNLSYTSISAPVRGEIANRSVQLGQHVSPGQALMSVIPLEKVWVVANFKETQIGDMKPGQVAHIRVDTYPGRRFRGKIQGIGAATGEITSLLPPQNATGNFVKVVQRIPVRIVFDQEIPDDIVLRPGQNVIATVYTR